MQAVKIETSLDYSGTIMSPNSLTKKIIGILTNHSNVVPFMSAYLCEFHHFVRLHPNKHFEQNSAIAIMTTLADNGMNLEMRLFSLTCAINPLTSNQTRNFDHRNSHHGNDRQFNRPVVAGIEYEIMYD